MTTVENSTVPQDFLAAQVSLLESGDTAGLAQRYAPDAVFVRVGVLTGIMRGRAEIKALFDDYLARNPQVTKLDAVEIADDTILYQAQETLAGQPVVAVGTLVFRDGLVWRQTAAFIAQPAAAS